MTAKRYKKLMRAYYTILYLDSQDSECPISKRTFNALIRSINTNVSRTKINGVPCTRDFIVSMNGARDLCKMVGDAGGAHRYYFPYENDMEV